MDTQVKKLSWSRRALVIVIIILLLESAVIALAIFTPDLLRSLPININIILGGCTFLAIITVLIGLRQSHESADKNEAYHTLARELSQVSNKSEIVINAIGDGVIAVDGKGIVQLINPAAEALTGWARQDAVSLDYRSIFKLQNNKSEPLADDIGPVQQVLRGGDSTAHNDLMLETNSGKIINISLLVSPVGQLGSGAIIVFRDITNEISENKQRAEFVSTASHEMRTPVAAIEGYLGLALNPATAVIDDKARAYLTKAHESAQHLGRLFQDLLDVSKAEDGRLKNAPVIVEVVSFLRDSCAMLAPKAEEKGLALIFQPDVSEDSTNLITPVFYTYVDQDHLRETFSNLIDNAIKYTKEGSVTANITGTDDRITISITDTGIGIAREDIPHLFQKFYRIDNTETREIGGTGLGLYLCRRLVESMGGRLWLQSEQGQGSTFFVELQRTSNDDVQRLQNQMEINS